MSLCKEKIEKGKIRKYFAKPKSGYHKWIKNQINRFIRRKPIEDDEVSIKTSRKPTKGWEY